MKEDVESKRFNFRSHGFAAKAFNTRGCTVKYAGTYALKDRDDPSAPRGDSEALDVAGYHIGIDNFPGPALVSWRSLDGDDHLVSVDIAAIFSDQKILHNVPDEDIPPGIHVGDPHIVLVVDDRTIAVYMQAHIPLKKPRIPGNRYSDYRADFVKAYTRTY